MQQQKVNKVAILSLLGSLVMIFTFFGATQVGWAETYATSTPVISSITATTTETGATINWLTDIPSTAQLRFGTSTNYTATTTKDTSFMTTHSQSIGSLAAGNTYHFQLIAENASGTAATSSDQIFTTLSVATTTATSTTPAVISSITTSVSDTGVDVLWNTDQPSTSQVMYGLSAVYTASTTKDLVLRSSHHQFIGGLSPSTTYHFNVISDNATGTVATSSDRIFTTLASATTTATSTGSFYDNHYAVQDGGKTFETDLLTSNEIGAAATSSARVTGTAGVWFDDSSMNYWIFAWSNREKITDAHLHCGAPGQNGPVVAPLYHSSGNTVSGELAQGDLMDSDIATTASNCSQTIGHSINSLADLKMAIQNGDIYVNIHSIAYPNGVARGQLQQVTHYVTQSEFDRLQGSSTDMSMHDGKDSHGDNHHDSRYDW